MLIGSLAAAILTGAHPVHADTPSGNFDVTIGLAAATAQTTTFAGDGSVIGNSNTNVTGTAFGAEYLFTTGNRLSVGPSLLAWSLPSTSGFPSASATAFGVTAAYRTSLEGRVRIAIGNEFRLGYDQGFGGPGQGTFATVELVAPRKGNVDSFTYVGIGYRFH